MYWLRALLPPPQAPPTQVPSTYMHAKKEKTPRGKNKKKKKKKKTCSKVDLIKLDLTSTSGMIGDWLVREAVAIPIQGLTSRKPNLWLSLPVGDISHETICKP